MRKLFVRVVMLLNIAGIACDEAAVVTAPLDGGGVADAGATAPDAGVASDAATPAPSPFKLGVGFKPGLAIDAAGTAYIAWYGNEPSVNTLQFCRLPRNATTCDVRHRIAAPGTTLARPFVAVTGGTVRVFSHRYGLTGDRFEAVYLFTSPDAGATFDAGRPIATHAPHDAIVGPGETASFTTDANTTGLFYENAAFTAVAPTVNPARLSTDHLSGGTVGLVDATTPLVAFADGSGNAQFRRYSGTGPLNVDSSWGAAQNIGNGDYMRLAGGPRGLFLSARSAARTLDVRRFDGTVFGAPVSIPEGTGELPQSDLSQDAGGRLHAVWPRIDVDGIRLYYATSDDGVAWKTNLLSTGAITPRLESIAQMRVKTAPDHIGLAAWEGPDAEVRALVVRPR